MAPGLLSPQARGAEIDPQQIVTILPKDAIPALLDTRVMLVDAKEASREMEDQEDVINLSPDKPLVLGEIHRILGHGGRFVISDIVSEGPVPQKIRQDPELWGQCLAGALAEEEFLRLMIEAGFYGVEVLKRYLYREVEGLRFYSVTVRGRKFAKGPDCVYIGHQALYLGPFSQACDDDGHTFPRGVPVEVCTDTAEKLKRPPYVGLFLLTDPTRGVGGRGGPGHHHRGEPGPPAPGLRGSPHPRPRRAGEEPPPGGDRGDR